ncbi:MAG: right-handed parallel beta-helix repeat-containing protein, partial [Promethearchaeota archaeon]
MRKEKNKRTFSQITLIILGICIILISSIEIHVSYNDPAQNQDNNFELKAATLLISHEPIRIDGNSALEAFCAGNGTDGLSWETAFTIENYSITSGNESGIFINSTDKFLIINNCSIENFLASNEYGIEIQNCSNILITMCSLINNTYGIYLDSSTNNTLTQNNCSFNDYGITLVNSESNTLF